VLNVNAITGERVMLFSDQRMNEQQCIPGILRKPTQTQKHKTYKHKNIQNTNTQMQKQTQKHKDPKRKTQNALKKRMN
jgi:hypothetical protein